MPSDRPIFVVIQADQLGADPASAAHRAELAALATGGNAPHWDYRPPDPLESTCLRADRAYSQWAYQGMLDFQVPEK